MRPVSDEVSRLRAAGFMVLQLRYEAPWIPPAPTVWARVASSSVEPTVSFSHDRDTELRDLEIGWTRLVVNSGLVSDDGRLLISLAKLAPGEGNWVMVSLSDGVLVFDELGPNSGEPEFVAVSLDGSKVCGVTAEEYEMWIVAL